MTRILAIDLGKFKSTACDYASATGEHTFVKLATRPQELHDLIADRRPDRVVIEAGNQGGWVKDLCEALGVAVQVANPNHEGWRWRNVKRKTDRLDALKLAKLSAVDQLPVVKLPGSRGRQWRALIEYRAKLVGRQTAVKNGIRALLDRQGLRMTAGKRGWSGESVESLRRMALPLEEAESDQLWRGQLHAELLVLEQTRALIRQVEAKLDALATQQPRVALLRTVPGVGPRLAEAVLDDPRRFKSRREVAAYVGLVPRLFESGQSSRSGGITGAGNRVLRTLLVEVSWMVRQYNPPMRAVFDQVCRGSRLPRSTPAGNTFRQLVHITASPSSTIVAVADALCDAD